MTVAELPSPYLALIKIVVAEVVVGILVLPVVADTLVVELGLPVPAAYTAP